MSVCKGPQNSISLTVNVRRTEDCFILCKHTHLSFCHVKYSLGRCFFTQPLFSSIKPSAQRQRKEPSTLVQSSSRPGHGRVFSWHSSTSEGITSNIISTISIKPIQTKILKLISIILLVPKHLAPVSRYPAAHFLQRAGPLPMHPTQDWSQSAAENTFTWQSISTQVVLTHLYDRATAPEQPDLGTRRSLRCWSSRSWADTGPALCHTHRCLKWKGKNTTLLLLYETLLFTSSAVISTYT